uniref:Uncharacterized protein n=1 Tax=Rhodnius prolixus TaxID=13249 RepID=T1H9F0_RHOPR
MGLAYADDAVLSARSVSALAGVFKEFEAAAKKMGLHINDDKTFYLKTSRRPGRVESSVNFGNHLF